MASQTAKAKVVSIEEEVLPPLRDDADPELELLNYEPLPSPTSIRLLEVLPSKDGEIRCLLTVADLEDAPAFDALSYTWGNPITIYEEPDKEPLLGNWDELMREAEGRSFEENQKHPVTLDLDAWLYRQKHPYIPYEKLDWNAERCHPIWCNDRTALVTQNLLDALNFLRRLVVGDIARPADAFEQICGRPRAKYIWIDAVCINQEDKPECSAQVAIMDRIFGDAQIVLGWLGPEHGMSRLGCHTMAKIFQKILEADSEGKAERGYLYSFEDVNEREWLALFALLQRLWFRRIWIVQEAVLAREMVLVCGTIILHWAVLERVLEYMVKNKLDDEVTELGKKLMRGGPISTFARKQLVAGVQVVGFSPARPEEWSGKLVVDPKASYAFVAGVRKIRERLGMEVVQFTPESSSKDNTDADNALEYDGAYTVPTGTIAQIAPVNEPGTVSLVSLLSMFRSCGATNPRDKVFALLGIISRSRSTLGGADTIRPDYTLPVQEIYVATTESILQYSGDLRILSHIQDPSLTCISGLPSWVPDLSVDPKRSEFDNPQEIFSASGKLREPVLARKVATTLTVEGFLVDNVACVAALEGCYFIRTAAVAFGLPKWYSSNHESIADYRPEHVSQDCDHVQLPLYHTVQEFSRGSNRSVTRVEAYWRTLVADCIDGHHPAPVSCGFGFSDWICQKLIKAENLVHMTHLATQTIPEASKAVEDKLREKIFCWAMLDAGENGGFYSLSELEALRGPLQQRIKASKGNDYEIDMEAGGMRFLPDKERLDNFVFSQALKDNVAVSDENGHSCQPSTSHPIEPVDSDRVAAFEARMSEVKVCRRMFRTSEHYLGMGPLSSQEGDELWILRGANVPFILRRLDDGSYRVIGEAYVHGIMHGEALQERASEYQQITLR